MQHLSRRFSGYSYLYVVIASAVWLIGSNLAITFEKSAYFFGEHSTLIHLLFMLLIFIPPLVAVALKRYPFREALRIRAFTAAVAVRPRCRDMHVLRTHRGHRAAR